MSKSKPDNVEEALCGQLEIAQISLATIQLWRVFDKKYILSHILQNSDSNTSKADEIDDERAKLFLTSGLRCGTCSIPSFDTLESQCNHFKSESHRINLKKKAKSMSLKQGTIRSSDSSDSESSGSDDAEYANELASVQEPVIQFTDGVNIYKVLKPVLVGRKESELDFKKALLQCRQSKFQWALFLLRSGRFAGAVFENTTAICHKTFQRYTTRRKQGGSQASHDASGSRAKSAGATLRRYNEAALKQDILELLSQWKEKLSTADLIFISSGRIDRSIFFSDTSRSLCAEDPRIRNIPFITFRPTFEEICRVRAKLQRVKITPIASLEAQVKKQPEPREKKSATPVSIPEPIVVAEEIETDIPNAIQLVRDRNYEAIKQCPDLDVNIKDWKDKTLLHYAAEQDADNFISYLLDKGANPSLLDARDRPPYNLCQSKKSRNIFRRFMAENPNAWDYSLSHISSALTDEMEQKKREKEAEKRRRARERKKVEKMLLAEAQALELKKKEEEAQRLAEAQACDFCHKNAGTSPFTRLTYKYCSSECVQNHRRQLLSEAAMRRFEMNMHMPLDDPTLQRVYAWIDEIPLSRPKKNIARDFSDGILAAEVVAYYFPKLVQMHNYSAANSVKQKQYNWCTLNRKVLKRLHISLSKCDINDLVQCKSGSIEQLLVKMQIKIAGYQETRSSSAKAAESIDKSGSSDNVKAKSSEDWTNKPAPFWVSGSPHDDIRAPTPVSQPSSPHHLLSSISHEMKQHEARNREVMQEKDQTISELNETIKVLELKVHKLEQLVRLKDGKIQTLVAKLRSQHPSM